MARARRKKSAGSSNSDEAIERAEEALGDGSADAEEDNFADDLSDVAEPDDGALEDDDFVDDDADGDDDPDAKAVEVPSALSTPNGLAVRREIERRLEERRLARDMDDLDFDLD